MMKIKKKLKLQSSFELLVTLSIGLAILLPIVIIAFIQLANANVSISSIQSQQAASKLAGVATTISSEGPPAKQLVQIQVPPDVENIYVGNEQNTIGHIIIFVVRASNGPSYITEYTPTNISGNLGGIINPGTYLINLTDESICPSNPSLSCVYMTPVV
ncbi:MAG: hypothetical protein QXD23_01320 [Candidatus Micrarchaeaceae archaeon]